MQKILNKNLDELNDLVFSNVEEFINFVACQNFGGTSTTVLF